MDKRVEFVIRRYARKVSRGEFFKLCKEIKEILEKILKEKYEFIPIKDAWEAVDSPEDLIVPWDEIDQEAQEDTLDILKGAKGDAFRLYQEGLDKLLETYESYPNLEEFFGPILDREYTDLYTLSEWGA